MKKILGLDLGTNSIGWALVEQDFYKEKGKIIGMGSRIIPMSQDILGEFDKGNSISQTAERTKYRSIRRLRERFLLRRERLHRVLNILDFLPKHYANEIDFKNRLGKFKPNAEPKLAYDNKQFIFKTSFEEMLADFKQNLPELLFNKNGKPAIVPYDWTIYYLRKKALTQKITKEELAWILLNFNQKRGYYQLRGEDDETPTNIKEYVEVLKVVQVQKGEVDKKYNKKHWYNITLNNGWIYSATFSEEPQWLNTEKEFLITEELDEDGNIKIVKDRKQDKDGNEKRKITPLPSFEEIDLMSKSDQDKIYKKIKAKTEITISNSGKTVGTFIYDTLLQKPNQKIRGKLVRTIERKFYKEELKAILQKQIELQPELFKDDLYNDCVRELYRNNEAHQLNLEKRDFVHLFMEDIIFYQRPLRSQKSSIGNCTLEYRKYKDNTGSEQTRWLKAIPKSNPFYQEFRIWQWMHNLSIYEKDNDNNVTTEFLNSTEDWQSLFEFLNSRKEVEQKSLLKHLLGQKGFKGKISSAEIEKYRWNYVEDKKYPCNETKALISTRLEKCAGVSKEFLTREVEQQLWHLIYSVTDKVDYEKALKSFARKYQLNETSFVDAFKKFPPFKSDFGSFSEKAIKKLLPLMRRGKYWNWNAVDEKSKYRIEKIISGEYDETIKDKIRDKTLHLTQENHFQGLPLWLAQYIVYSRHSEAAEIGKWNSADELEKYLKDFKPHSLRNPIVEQVVTETLRVIKDIWEKYGSGTKDFFDEIHIELGREMKNTAEDRKKITNMVKENENTNLRIKALLTELQNDGSIENVRPHSLMQQEILKIYEDGVLNSDVEIEDDILKISKTAQPSSTDLKRYKLWLEQKYKSPYTGQIIPLNRLFTPEYEIEHIIPQSRYFDDSFSNKVICEAAVNKLKGNNLGLEFIKKFHGQIVELGTFNNGIFTPTKSKQKAVTILSVSAYEEFVKQHYAKNRSKRNKLLLEEIPEKMIARQINDTRYISKFISGILSNIVRADQNDNGVNSKNVISGNGKITSVLKTDWGLSDVWNDLILPRFERMNELTKTTNYTIWNENHQKFLPTVPLSESKNFQKKRIDHRHHALDALVIACTTREHVNFMNNEHALRKGKTKEEKQGLRYDLRNNLCIKKYNDDIKENYKWIFKKPWESFTQEAKKALENLVVSFKQNLRVINKATNHYQKYIDKNNERIKEWVEQKGTNWAIRKQMHTETVSGKVELPWYKTPKGKILTATRKSIDNSFDLKTIESITDTGIQKILKNYLKAKDGNPEIAFSPEGIDFLNKNIAQYNDGKNHQPIYKARIFEQGSKFQVGQTGNNKHKYVEAAKGTNLFFAVYEEDNGKRSYGSIPLNEVIERQKQGLPPVEFTDKNGFYLCPNDLVYLPTGDELENPSGIEFHDLSPEKKKNIYKVVSFSGSQIFFVRHDIATSIVNKVEFTTLNKMERAINGVMIKENCIKLNIDRLGNISPAR